jgi:hypothetical protein
VLATIEFSEKMIGSGRQIVVLWQVVRREGNTASEFGHEFRPIPIGKRVELLKQLLGGRRHEPSVPRCVLGVKFVDGSEA